MWWVENSLAGLPLQGLAPGTLSLTGGYNSSEVTFNRVLPSDLGVQKLSCIIGLSRSGTLRLTHINQTSRRLRFTPNTVVFIAKRGLATNPPGCWPWHVLPVGCQVIVEDCTDGLA